MNIANCRCKQLVAVHTECGKSQAVPFAGGRDGSFQRCACV